MCVGLAAKIISVKDGVAMVDCTGAKREISAELLDDLEPGDYVMVHAGVRSQRSLTTTNQRLRKY